jgi:hypothetical protein
VFAAGLILVGAALVVMGGGELPLTAYGVVALVVGAVLAARDQLRRWQAGPTGPDTPGQTPK